MRFLGLLLVIFCLQAGANPTPLHRAHSHNDYKQKRPLLDALERGFTSIEVDVYSAAGDLMVAHTRGEIEAGQTLRSLYLDPLKKWIDENDGRIYSDDSEFFLLIDFKSSGDKTYKRLKEQLVPYQKYLSKYENGVFTKGPVTIVISGNRPIKMVKKEKVRYVSIDGRYAHLDSTLPVHFMPIISIRWGWSLWYRQNFPGQDRLSIRQMVDKAHAQGRRIRFYGTPNREKLWDKFMNYGVDLINVDHLDRFVNFMKKRGERRLASDE